MKIDQNKCVGCQTCKNNCPMQAISVNSNNKCEIDPKKCVNCCTCRPVSPNRIREPKNKPRYGLPAPGPGQRRSRGWPGHEA